MRSTGRLLLSVTVISLLLAVASCGKEKDTPQAKLKEVQPKTLAFIGDLTNDDFAKAALQGATIGVAPSAQAGSLIRIDVKELDTGGDAAKVGPLLQGFLTDETAPPRLAVIVALRGDALAAAGDQLSKAGIGFVVLSSELPALGDRGWKGGIRIATTSTNEAAAAASLASAAAAGKGACVAGAGSPGGDGFAAAAMTALTAAGVTATSVPGTGAAAAVEAAGCGVVVAEGDGQATAALRAELDGAGLQAVGLIVDSAAVGPHDAGAAGAGATQAVCACAAPSLATSTTASQFAQQFQEKFGSAPPPFAAEGRDAATVVLQGTRAAYLDDAGMLQWFASASGVPGVNGSLAFGPDGELTSPPAVSLLSSDGSGWAAEQANVLASTSG